MPVVFRALLTARDNAHDKDDHGSLEKYETILNHMNDVVLQSILLFHLLWLEESK